MKIRVEKEEDWREVENITREAFWNLYCPGANEHFILHLMRKSGDFIPELSLVAEVENKIVGHILYSHSKVIYENGSEVPTITFGPVSVRPDMQNKGIGSLLIKQSLKKAKELGFKAVIILGYPQFYIRFGFKNTKHHNIKSPDNNYYLGMQVLELVSNYLPTNIQGIFHESQNFNPDMEQLKIFDKQFPEKEEFRTKSQQAFQYVSTRLWNQECLVGVEDLNNRDKIEEVTK